MEQLLQLPLPFQEEQVDVSDLIENSEIREFGCADTMNLIQSGRLHELYWSHTGCRFHVHLNCPYMYKMGLTTVEQQNQAIQELEDQVSDLNGEYGIEFNVIIDPDGSACSSME